KNTAGMLLKRLVQGGGVGVFLLLQFLASLHVPFGIRPRQPQPALTLVFVQVDRPPRKNAMLQYPRPAAPMQAFAAETLRREECAKRLASVAAERENSRDETRRCGFVHR